METTRWGGLLSEGEEMITGRPEIKVINFLK